MYVFVEYIKTPCSKSYFEFLHKVFLGLMCLFSCVLWVIFWPFYFYSLLDISLSETKMTQKLTPNHRTINSNSL